MLEVIAKLELQKLSEKINSNSSICYSLQIDGSVDKLHTDNKFVCIRYVDENGTNHNAFLRVCMPKEKGARGLLEAILKTTNCAQLQHDKIAGITTDCKSANTGIHSGLWKLLQDELQRNIITVWCTCHRSD
jgi:hypothetical protein